MKSITLSAASAAGALMCALACLPAQAEEAAGRWVGQLPNPVGLHLVLTISKESPGRYKAVLKSPDQGSEDIQITSVEATPDRLQFTQADLGIVYEARWDESTKAWAGVLKQSGQELQLDLKRSDGS